MRTRWKFAGRSRNGLWYVWEVVRASKDEPLLVAWAPVASFWDGFLPLTAKRDDVDDSAPLKVITRW